jgi:GNAT superfamily N-acetyltransferase
MPYRATPADCHVMAAIHASAFATPDAWSGDVFGLQLALPNVFGLLHPSGGMVLVRVAADEAEILTLAVSPSVRRGGIAAALLREGRTCCLSGGFRREYCGSSTLYPGWLLPGRTAPTLLFGRFRGAGFAARPRSAQLSRRASQLICRAGSTAG